MQAFPKAQRSLYISQKGYAGNIYSGPVYPGNPYAQPDSVRYSVRMLE